MRADNDNTPEIPVDLADYLAHALYGRNARACDLIGGSNARLFEDALSEIMRLRREGANDQTRDARKVHRRHCVHAAR